MVDVLNPLVPVAAPVPEEPQVSLLTSALKPVGPNDPPSLGTLTILDADPVAKAAWESELDLFTDSDLADSIKAEQANTLKASIERELATGAYAQGDDWVRGFTYAPEQRASGINRSGQDYTSVDTPPLPAPSGLALAFSAAGGDLTAATYEYQVTVVNANGESTPCTLVPITTGSTGEIIVTWQPVVGNATYNVYGNSSGSIGLLATVGPFDSDQTPTFTDDGSYTPGVAPPSTNTTGGVGTPVNIPNVQCVPWLILAEDRCSAFGWEARDYIGRATRWNRNALADRIENELWTGALAQARGWPNNYLANPLSCTILNATSAGALTAVSVVEGMRVLQGALANTGFGGRGMIHTRPESLPDMLSVRRVGTVIYDLLDNVVVPGVGYPGTGPGYGVTLTPSDISGNGTAVTVTVANSLVAGQVVTIVGSTSTGDVYNLENVVVLATGLSDTQFEFASTAEGTYVSGASVIVGGAGPTQMWMYGTDMVTVRVEPDKSVRVFPDSFDEAIDRGIGGFPNTIAFRTERYGAASFDGYRHFAVLINLDS